MLFTKNKIFIIILFLFLTSTALWASTPTGVINTVDLKADSTVPLDGDIIGSSPKLELLISTTVEVDVSTFKLYIDNILVTDGTSAGGRYDAQAGSLTDPDFIYTPKVPLSAGNHTVDVQVENKNGTKFAVSKSGLRVLGGEIQISGPVLIYPNPFDPRKGTARIAYTLSENADVTMYVFDAVGRIICRQQYVSGAEGGHAGYNEATWDGRTGFGGFAENDSYLLRIISAGKVLGRSKIMILKIN